MMVGACPFCYQRNYNRKDKNTPNAASCVYVFMYDPYYFASFLILFKFSFIFAYNMYVGWDGGSFLLIT